MKILNYIIMFVFLTSLVNAQIQITKESPQEIKINDIIEIKIHISNPYPTEQDFTIEEILPREIEVIEPTETLTKKTDGLESKYYKWTTTISPNKIKTITYKIKPTSLGDYTIGETKITDSSGTEYYSNLITFTVKCNSNNQCSTEENYITCPEDCESGISDGRCDYKADGICDPDCTQDPDCKEMDFTFLIYIFSGIMLIIILLVIFSKKMQNKLPQNDQ